MIYLYIRHRVADYARWKEGFDRHLGARQAGGATAELILLRNVDDRDEVIVILGWSDLKQARLFSQSISLQLALKKMGVIGVPKISFFECN